MDYLIILILGIILFGAYISRSIDKEYKKKQLHKAMREPYLHPERYVWVKGKPEPIDKKYWE
jgi:hypothetical protein